MNWLIYYPIEKWLSKITDCLVTINEEDYRLAIKHKFGADSIMHIHGVGVDTDKYKPVDDEWKRIMREDYGYNSEDFVMFYAAEFNKNKNQSMLIKALSLIKSEIPTAKLLLAGEGKLLEECRKLAKQLGVAEMVEFLGFKEDIEQLLKISDIAVASSNREGLPVNVMEAMASALPVIASGNRGHRELILNNENGWVIENGCSEDFATKMKFLAADKQLRSQLGANGRKEILQRYSTKKVLEEKSLLYKSYMEEMEEAMWAIQ